MALTVKAVERLKRPGRYGDGGGLYVEEDLDAYIEQCIAASKEGDLAERRSSAPVDVLSPTSFLSVGG